jgi:hypothetical protein
MGGPTHTKHRDIAICRMWTGNPFRNATVQTISNGAWRASGYGGATRTNQGIPGDFFHQAVAIVTGSMIHVMC